jgi:hypothetical protein
MSATGVVAIATNSTEGGSDTPFGGITMSTRQVTSNPKTTLME